MRTTFLPLFAFLLSTSALASESNTEQAKRDTRVGKQKLYQRADGSVNIDFANEEINQIDKKYKATRQAFTNNLNAGNAAAAAVALAQGITKRDGAVTEAKAKMEKRQSKPGFIATATDYVVGVTDVLYYVTLYIGSKAQALSFQIDTGSSDIWMPIQQINGMPGYLQTSGDTSYVNTGSSFQISYVSGNVAGTVAKDSIGVFSRAAKALNQYFGAVTQVSSNFLNTPTSGILGIGFASIARTGQPTYIDTLYNQGQISDKVFGLYLSAGGQKPSTFSIGTLDTSHYTGGIFYTPVISQTYWEVMATGLTVNSLTKSNSFRAAIDSGTTFVYVPVAIATAYFANFPGAMSAPEYNGNNAYYWKFPCATTNVAGFRWAGGRGAYNMPTTSFSMGTVQSPAGYCLSTVIGLNINDNSGVAMAIVGDSFMKNFYNVFDYDLNGAPAVGFATVVN